MQFDVLLQCEGHAGMWCSMAETGIYNFLPNLISAKPQPSREEGLWGHESPVILKKKKASMIRMHNIFASQLPTQRLWLAEGWMVSLSCSAEQRYWRLQHGGSRACAISRSWKLYFLRACRVVSSCGCASKPWSISFLQFSAPLEVMYLPGVVKVINHRVGPNPEIRANHRSPHKKGLVSFCMHLYKNWGWLAQNFC